MVSAAGTVRISGEPGSKAARLWTSSRSKGISSAVLYEKDAAGNRSHQVTLGQVDPTRGSLTISQVGSDRYKIENSVYGTSKIFDSQGVEKTAILTAS